ncbi:MAG TPA: hypothetical protein VFR36_00235 [Sphingomicrobium sp.]|nr:hypothetical protein [Sphingomicrobium sp.]
MGGNRGPPLRDPRTLEDAFPGLRHGPGGAIFGLADNFLDLTGPGQALTTELAKAHAKILVRQIQALDLHYRNDALERGGFPSTAEGQANLINGLRLDRAKAFYKKGELRPLQLETLRFLQTRVDEEYRVGLDLLKAGRLPVRLSAQEAMGNYIDRQVRKQLRNFYQSHGISMARGESAQVNRRAYNSSESTYSLPDSQVGNIAFDVSLTAKSLSTPQIRRFFQSDFRPQAIVIVRPSQLGPNSTYVLTRPTGF